MVFCLWFSIYDDASKPRVNVPLNFKLKVSGQREKIRSYSGSILWKFK